MSYVLAKADARRVPLADKTVQCVVTSPPYFGLRDYGSDGQIGLEGSPDAYVAEMVKVFREVWRVLRDDGVVFLNIGDSYAGGGGFAVDAPSSGTSKSGKYGTIGGLKPGGIKPSNVANCLHSGLKFGVLSVRGGCTLTVTAKGQGVLRPDQLGPDGEFATFLRVKRVFLKQRDDHFREILDSLDAENAVRIPFRLAGMAIQNAHGEMFLDPTEDIEVVITQGNLDSDPAFKVASVSRSGAAEHGQAPLAIEEAGEPVAERVGDIQSTRDAVAVDALSEGLPKVDPVNQSIAFADSLHATTRGLSDFRVTAARPQHLGLSLNDGRVRLAVDCVGQLLISNGFGSLVHYSELYEQATRKSNAMRPKQQLGIPDLVKRALMEDGWICRDTIIWHKPAPMPESVTDRTTKAHEFVFLLSKSERYFYDAEAIKEPSTQPDRAGTVENTFHSASREGAGRNDVGRSVLRTEFRNCRSVWTINTQPFKGSHFATMPPMLAERCIKAGTSERGCCPSCRAPWVRSVEKDRQATRPGADTKVAGLDGMTIGNRDPRRHTTTTKTTGWNPACVCDAGEPVPCLTFDPFNGAGTTGAVATGLGRDYAGTDLSTEYLAMADRRISRPHAPIAPASRDIPMPLFA